MNWVMKKEIMTIKITFLSRLKWLYKRLSIVSIEELLFRLQEQLDIWLMYIKYIFYKPNAKRKNYKFLTQSEKILPNYKWKEITDSNKKELLNGKIPLFGSEWFWKNSESLKKWHQAPENDNVWPDKFFNSIQFRQGNSTGDIRIAWEASRLQHLIALALIVQGSHNSKETTTARDLYCDDILSWYQQNPIYNGIHYVSSMECALRIISLSISYDLIRSDLGDKREEVSFLVGKLITEHADFIIKRMSFHSSAGNHILAESAGLIFAGLLFSEHPSSQNWLSKGMKIFEYEIDRQINHSGYGLEGASTYLIQIIEYALLCDSLFKAYKIDTPPKMLKALRRGLEEVRAIHEKLGFMPVVGDSDSSFAVSYLFDELFDNERRSSGHEVNTHLLAIGTTSNPLSLVFYNGPLGMEPLFGHGHAHALSIQLYFNGKPILSDPGTYSYTGYPSWRDYFRSTKAHNTVNVNNSDQAQQELIFMWSKPYQCENLVFEKHEDCYICIAQHNGYFDQGVMHKRMLIFSPSKGLYVKDFLISSCEYEAELCWNVNLLIDNQKIFDKRGSILEFEISNSNNIAADSKPFSIESGWYSPCYNKKERINRLVSNIKSTKDSSFESLFCLADSGREWVNDAEKRAMEIIKKSKTLI